MKRRVLTPEGADALAEAQAASDLLRRAREQASKHVERRRSAVLAANQNGASYSVLAEALGVTVGLVARIVAEARSRDEAA